MSDWEKVIPKDDGTDRVELGKRRESDQSLRFLDDSRGADSSSARILLARSSSITEHADDNRGFDGKITKAECYRAAKRSRGEAAACRPELRDRPGAEIIISSGRDTVVGSSCGKSDAAESCVAVDDGIEILDIEELEEASASGGAGGAAVPSLALRPTERADVTRGTKAGNPEAFGMLGRVVARKLRVGLEGDAELHLAPLPAGWSAAKLLAHARELPLEVEPTLMMYGQASIMNRCVGFFSDVSIGYVYARQISKAQPLTGMLKDLIDAVNAALRTDYNGILVNRYRNGSDYMGAHADDESELGSAVPSGTASASSSSGASASSSAGVGAAAAGSAALKGVCVSCISLGAVRTFRIRSKATGKVVEGGDQRLPHGSLVTMAGADFQRLHTHEIPVEKQVHGERFSLTFRRHLK